VDHQGVPFQEETDGGIGILQGTVQDLIRIPEDPPVPLPVIDRGDDISQGCKVTAPLHDRGIPFVALEESSPMEHHQERTGTGTVPQGLVQVHGQVFSLGDFRLVRLVMKDTAIDDIPYFPHSVLRDHIQTLFRKNLEIRDLIGV
jgi:hypothetical protein